MKLQSTKGSWTITDNGTKKEFTDSIDAWIYVLLMKEVRAHTVKTPQSLYPVTTLDPVPSMLRKKVLA